MLLLNVDGRQLTLGHEGRLVEKTDGLVAVEIMVILRRGGGCPHLMGIEQRWIVMQGSYSNINKFTGWVELNYQVLQKIHT